MAERCIVCRLTLTLLSRQGTHAKVVCFLREEDDSNPDIGGAGEAVQAADRYIRNIQIQIQIY